MFKFTLDSSSAHQHSYENVNLCLITCNAMLLKNTSTMYHVLCWAIINAILVFLYG